ncbi:MAG TPA: hypothetical protein VLG50_03965 [Candidatus Saccharimonadales bacterium]|nr:hypothetical protein [Candidatus Saccharimonadales bacterium]
MFKKIILMSGCIMLATSHVSYAPGKNKHQKTVQNVHQQGVENIQRERVDDCCTSFCKLAITGMIFVGFTFAMMHTPNHCCQPLGAESEGLQLFQWRDRRIYKDGIVYEELFDDRYYCSEVRKVFCPNVTIRNRLYALTIPCFGNYDAHGNSHHCILINKDDKETLEKRGMIVDDQGYVTYPTPKK